MTLTALAQTLRKQAQGGAIILNEDIVSTAEADRIAALFLLGKGKRLTVDGVKQGDIPDPANDSLRIGAGTLSVFGAKNPTPTLVFTLDGKGAVQALIDVGPPAGWKLTDGFPTLAIYPFNRATISDGHFVYSSAQQADYQPWPDRTSESIALAPGLNFAAWMGFDIFTGAVQLVQDLVGVGATVKFCGPFSPDPAHPYPVMTLTGALDADKRFELTDKLSIGAPALVIEVAPPVNLLQSIDLWLTMSVGKLAFSVGLAAGDPGLSFRASPRTGQTFTAADITTLPGLSDFNSYIPGQVKEVFADCALNEFAIRLTGAKTVSYIGLSVGTVPSKSLTLIPDEMVLDSFTMRVDSYEPFGDSPSTAVSLAASCILGEKIFPDPFSFELLLDNAGEGKKWEIARIGGRYDGVINLGRFVAGLADTRPPPELNDISFSEITVAVTKEGSGYTYALHARADASFTILGSELTATLGITAAYSKTGYDIDLSGSFAIADEIFLLDLQLARSGTAPTSFILTASWTAKNALTLQDIANAFGLARDMPEIPEGLNLSLNSATFHYDYGKQELGIGLVSAKYGNAVFTAFENKTNKTREESKWQFFFGVAAKQPIQLGKLPVVESFLGDSDDVVEIKDIHVVLSSAAIDADAIGQVNTFIGSLPRPQAGGGYPQVPNVDNKGMAAGAALSMQVDLAGTTFPVKVGAGSAARPPTPPPVAAFTAPGAAAPAGGGASATWFQVGKSIGPVSFQRVGVQYQDGRLYVLLDASLGFSALTLSLDGLGVGSPLTTFEPVFHLDGLSLAFSAGPVTLDGGFLKMPAPLPDHVTEEYIGSVTIKIQSYLISGVGAYAKLSSGDTSVFLFAEVKGEFGGPPAFFITGFMGGFGYNSQLRLPGPDEVHTFPFVAGLDDPSIFGSANPTPLQVMDALAGRGGNPPWVTPARSENWLAAGIMFRSFEIVLGHALLVVTFGKEFEIALLGLAALTLPQDATKPSYVHVELQLEAVLKPDEGSFIIAASLTANSFVITKDCHLTGGFAFCIWFGKNPHFGDFVVTIGGYHPAFDKPEWYPTVSPVGFNWPVGGGVTVKGGAYFAITPSAAMAGGSLQVLFQKGDLQAWFIAYANLLVRWKPFYFTANIGVSIGASYRLNLAVTSVTVSIELGATLDMWGPPTGGTVHIDLFIISFSVGFGAGKPDAAALTLLWPDFKGLLPNTPPAKMASPSAAADATSALTVLDVHINGGLVRENKADNAWIVRADALVFTTATAVPASEMQASGHPTPLPDGAPKGGIDIRPMQLSGVVSTHNVKLHFVDNNEDKDLSTWAPVVQTGKLPEALWGKPLPAKAAPAPSAAVISGLPTGMQFAAPPATAGPAVGPFDANDLIMPLGGGYMPLDPAHQRDPIPSPSVDSQALRKVIKTLKQGWPDAGKELLAKLQTLGAAPPTSAPLIALGDMAGRVFPQPPMLAA
jgi:hypothetical protein